MARIPEHEIERLKEEVALERLVEAAGVALERRGKDLVGCCPFHEDRSPSLVISPQKNLWHCLGACQEGGSVDALGGRVVPPCGRAAARWDRAVGAPGR